MENLVEEPADREAYIKLANYPLIKHTDMESEMRTEAVEICTGAIEKFPGNQEKSAQLIKVRGTPVFFSFFLGGVRFLPVLIL